MKFNQIIDFIYAFRNKKKILNEKLQIKVDNFESFNHLERENYSQESGGWKNHTFIAEKLKEARARLSKIALPTYLSDLSRKHISFFCGFRG